MGGLGSRRRRVLGVFGVGAAISTLVVLLVGAALAAPIAVTFAAKVDFAVGTRPTSVAVADLNGDHHLDLVAANLISNNLSVRLGDGAGGFGLKTDFGAGSGSIAVAVAYVDGDTRPDLVAANGGAASVSVLLGDGTGGFGPKTDFPTQSGPESVATGDVNGDTFVDVVTPHIEANSVSVLLGDGTGGFGPRTEFTAGPGPASVVVRDLDGDTRLDLVVANFESASVSVLLGDGAGGFGTQTDFGAGFGPLSVAVADLNRDARLDLAVANFDSSSVSVLLGDGAGGFGVASHWATGSGGRSVAVGDLNGDAFLDLGVATSTAIGGDGDGNMWSLGVSLLMGDGSGEFGPKTDLITGSTPMAVVMGDVNGDTRLDLVVANSDSNSVSVLRNTTVTLAGAPTIGAATAGDGQATVSWTTPTFDGGSPVTGYVVTPYIGYFPLASQTFGSTATTQTITGLTNGTTYRFRVRATNTIGAGSFSRVTNPVTPVPSTVPGAPTIGVAVDGDGEAMVSWTAPASDGGSPVTGYVVTPYIGYYPLSPVTFASTATTQTITGLTNGTQYRFRVQAINAVGTSGYSKVTNPVTPTA